MNRQSFVMIALAALVAGAAVLVYAQQPKDGPVAKPPAANAGTEAPKAEAAAPESTGEAPQILYDLDALPDPVKRMLEQIIVAAQSGEIENMRPVLESNELKPMVAASHVDDPIAFWKKASADGNGRDVLAAMLNVLAVGFVKTGTGHDEMYVWPYFAERDLAKLTPSQEVEFYRIVPPERGVPMKEAGKYAYYRLGISPSGVWHYFLE